MHPEVQQDHPGDCPKCGMALEPKTVTAGTDDGENAELRDMTRRFWIGAALTLPVFKEINTEPIDPLSVVEGNALDRTLVLPPTAKWPDGSVPDVTVRFQPKTPQGP
jgi:hypothetical protein